MCVPRPQRTLLLFRSIRIRGSIATGSFRDAAADFSKSGATVIASRAMDTDLVVDSSLFTCQGIKERDNKDEDE